MSALLYGFFFCRCRVDSVGQRARSQSLVKNFAMKRAMIKLPWAGDLHGDAALTGFIQPSRGRAGVHDVAIYPVRIYHSQ